ncbi:hypothetical protein M3J09_002503 [Ascochyta lentis]
MPSNRVCTWPTPRTCTTRPPCLGGATQPPHLPWTFHLASLLLLLLFILWGLFILWFYAWKVRSRGPAPGRANADSNWIRCSRGMRRTRVIMISGWRLRSGRRV